LHYVAEHVVAAVTIHHHERANALLYMGCTDVGYNGCQCGWAEADRSGKR